MLSTKPRSPRSSPRGAHPSAGSLLETLGTHNMLTQDMLTGMVRIIEGAMQAGQGCARVQLLRADHAQYHYVASEGQGTMTLPVHDAQTLSPLAGGSRQRVQLARPAFDIVLWLRGQGLGVLCATRAMAKGRLGAEPALAPFLYVVAVFLPQQQKEQLDAPPARLASLWNTQYMAKCLDATALDSWAQRLQRAQEAGASHCALCTLYRGTDFDSELAPAEADALLSVREPRHHLTMEVLRSGEPPWQLHKRFAVLVGFARQYGYAWTLCHTGPDAGDVLWAYFTLLLDPLLQYEALK